MEEELEVDYCILSTLRVCLDDRLPFDAPLVFLFGSLFEPICERNVYRSI